MCVVGLCVSRVGVCWGAARSVPLPSPPASAASPPVGRGPPPQPPRPVAVSASLSAAGRGCRAAVFFSLVVFFFSLFCRGCCFFSYLCCWFSALCRVVCFVSFGCRVRAVLGVVCGVRVVRSRRVAHPCLGWASPCRARRRVLSALRVLALRAVRAVLVCCLGCRVCLCCFPGGVGWFWWCCSWRRSASFVFLVFFNICLRCCLDAANLFKSFFCVFSAFFSLFLLRVLFFFVPLLLVIN